MNSFSQMIKNKEIRRGDLLRIRYSSFHVEPGFNLRDDTEELKKSIDDLADYIFNGGKIPPIEVRPRDEGGVWIVDGHRRYAAIGIAIKRGAPIDLINAEPFVGNDVDRLARVITSARNKPLTALEVSKGFKRLRSFGLSMDEIARAVNKSRAHVDSLLTLGDANNDVHQAVEKGHVSASVATDLVRQHGANAGEVINTHLQQAKRQGKTKVTAQVVKASKPSPKCIDNAIADLVRDMFKSANSIPVERITITRSQYEQVLNGGGES